MSTQFPSHSGMRRQARGRCRAPGPQLLLGTLGLELLCGAGALQGTVLSGLCLLCSANSQVYWFQ